MMTTSDGNDADQPPTAAAGDGDATTFVPPPTQAAPELAWSNADDAGFIQRQLWRLTWGHVAVLLACAGVVALTISFVAWALTRITGTATSPDSAERMLKRARARYKAGGDQTKKSLQDRGLWG